MNDINLIDITQNLNELIPDDSPHSFSFQKWGYVEIITFDDVVLWDSENDERAWKVDREGNQLDEREDLTFHILKKYNEYVEENNTILTQLKLWWTLNNK